MVRLVGLPRLFSRGQCPRMMLERNHNRKKAVRSKDIAHEVTQIVPLRQGPYGSGRGNPRGALLPRAAIGLGLSRY
jgi:hypothetical protein